MTKKYYYLFWLKSSHGTDEKTVVCLNTTTKDIIEDDLLIWCKKFGAWEVSENYLTYGYKSIKLPSFKEMKQKLIKVVNQRSKINEKYKLINAMYLCRLYEQQQRLTKRG